MAFLDRLKHSWNAFVSSEASRDYNSSYGTNYSNQPYRQRLSLSSEKSVVTSVYTRLAVDAAAVDIHHIRLDNEKRYADDFSSGLEYCLNTEANIDQSGIDLRQNIVSTMLENGVAAVVPVDTVSNPKNGGSIDIKTLRVGTVISWFPRHVQVRVYDDRPNKGEFSELILPKSMVALIVNPFYSTMNEPNSTLRRLIHKLSILDAVDEQSGSGKLDLIIQLPYVIKNETKRLQAEQRRKDIEVQLKNSKYGIAYTDGTEKITQLNRAAENNLFEQVKYLTELLYNQLGLTKEIIEGNATEEAMLAYRNRTIKPILEVIVAELNRKFLTKTARSQNQTIQYFTDPFEFLTLSAFADIADKLTRNEVVSSNELRGHLRLKPRAEPSADELRNKNLNPTGEPTDDTGVQ